MHRDQLASLLVRVVSSSVLFLVGKWFNINSNNLELKYYSLQITVPNQFWIIACKLT